MMTIRRLKTYAGSQGFTYQYYFVGKRPKLSSEGPVALGHEYVFDVTSDRKSTYEVNIFLPEIAAAEWAELHQRSLSDPEKYAAVKMRLFRAFDEPGELQGRVLVIDVGALEESLSSLGVN